MAYTKNHESWLVTDPITNTILNNFETIYEEIASYLLSHNHDALYYTKTQMEAKYFYAANDGDGSGLDADLIYHADGNKHAASFSGLGVPIGLIILWYGTEANIPANWLKCDGNNGTIDMRNMIPIGAGVPGEYNDYKDPGATGGSATFTVDGDITIDGHSVTVDELPAHTHTLTDNYATANTAGGGGTAYQKRLIVSTPTNTEGSGSAHDHTGSITGNAVAAMPHYYSLFYIQRMS